MTNEEKINKEIEIVGIKTVDDLLNWLEEDLLNAKRSGLTNDKIFELYRHALIGQYEEDDCAELASNVIVSPLKIKLWKGYEDDLFRAENYICKIGVKTRCGKTENAFRPMRKICNDIAKVYGVNLYNNSNDVVNKKEM